MLHFYGSPMSSAGRTHLMLEETGAGYEYHKVNLRDPASKAEFAKINPTGKIPFLVDGDLRLPESVAINFYLAEKYAPQMWATSLDDRARIYAWSLWATTNLQPEVLRVMMNAMKPEGERNAKEIEQGKAATTRYVGDLEHQLPSSGHLVAGKYTVADLNVASVVNLVVAMQAAELGPKTRAWFDAIKARPAWQRVAAAG
jgi:glutathione S-transferase